MFYGLLSQAAENGLRTNRNARDADSSAVV
jgi:hypothetical protein